MSRRKLYDILGVSIFWGIPILLIIRLNFFKTGSEASKLYDSGIKKYDSENYTGAIQDFTKAIELDSGYIDAYQERGRVRYDLGDYTGAVQDYDKVIELDKKDGEGYNWRGVVKYDLGDYTGAIQDYDKAIELGRKDDYDAKTYNNRGITRYDLGDYTGAVLDYYKAIELFQNYDKGLLEDYISVYAITYDRRGMVKYRLGDYTGAIQDYDKAIELDSGYTTAYINRGNFKINFKDINAGCRDLQKASNLGETGIDDKIKEYCKGETISTSNSFSNIRARLNKFIF